jgi:murein DD-endopeptidase MepM/ murein hydrolase activator NlpD
MRGFVVLVILALALLVTVAEPLGPQVELATPVSVVGAATPLRVIARDRGTGLAMVEIRVASPQLPEAVVLAHEEYPRTSWYGSGVHEVELTPVIDAAKAHIPEGPATLEIWATDHSWLRFLRRGPLIAQPIAVDLTPPSIEILSKQHVARLGGSECLIYKVSPDAVGSGVQVGTLFFPGTAGLFADPALRAALFALPESQPNATVAAVAVDAAGNRRTSSFDLVVRPRTFADKTLTIDDDFLRRKVPDLLRENQLPVPDDLVQGYLAVNRDLRKITEERLRQTCRDSDPSPHWQGALLRMPNSAPLSGFADRRTYLHNGQVIDHQTHLGFDLASLKLAPVPAAADGRVAFVGPLGIYGTTVVLDHGLGLFTLYGHLSSTAVTQGASVARGDTVGKTGETGLAGGDHLHFSTMIHGVHVDPVEWWDGHWITDHVDARLAEFPKAAGPAATPRAPAGPAPGAPVPAAPAAPPPAAKPAA